MSISAEVRKDFEEAVALANLPVLLMVLVQLTGELKWLEDPYKPIRPAGNDDNDSGNLPEEIQQEIRDAALKAIVAWKEGAPVAMPELSEEMLIDMLAVAVGEQVPAEYGELTATQLGQEKLLDPTPANVPDGFKVLVIGGGLGGVCTAVYLEQAGIPYVVIEKSPAIGGVWLENRYPGCGVDSPNHLYCYSFSQSDWSMYFALGDEIREYIENTAKKFNIVKNFHFETGVNSVIYDEETQAWTASISSADGKQETFAANVVISAVGLFNPPVIPNIPGLDEWTGQKWHSACWPEGADGDVAGKRVALVGTGATGMQIGPEIQDKVESLAIFQRSRQWVVPHHAFRKPVADAVRFLMREVPLYYKWYRVLLSWNYMDRLHPLMQIDPDWPHPERSINAFNESVRKLYTRYMAKELGDKADELLDKVVPDYPPFGKRILLDNGWYRMLTKDNVELVDSSIKRLEGNRIIAKDGTEVEADVLVLATGFGGQKMIDTYDVVGRGGKTLRDEWGDDDPKAYLGTCIPDFPNFFVLYGPNLQPGHGGSLTFSLEMQLRYVMDVIRKMASGGLGAVEVRQDVYERYNDAVDEAHGKMLWTHPGVSTYYKNAAGRVVINSPWRNVDFFAMTREADLDEFLTEEVSSAQPESIPA